MAKKITLNEYTQRIKKLFPNAKFQVIEYTTISKPCKIKCLKCGNIRNYSKASNALKWNLCCENISRIKLAQQEINKLQDYSIVKKMGQQLIIKHNRCGKEFKRNLASVIKNANHCPFCDGNTGLVLSFDEAQNQINKEFFGTIKLLQYNAIRTQNTYKCLKCGLIFKQTQKNLLASRGCPKCDRFKSKGEIKIAKLLKENNIFYKQQVSFKDLSQGKQRFDFVVYKDQNCNKIDYMIECQGEQHYEEKNNIFDSLSIIQQRDERKRKYCKEKGYPLYEIKYKNGKLLNLDILPINNS